MIDVSYRDDNTRELMPLEPLLDALTAARRMRICVTDLSGIMRYEKLNISWRYRTHTSRFCEAAAKSTSSGLALCLECKEKSNAAACEGKCFSGRCRFGICESVCPVEYDGRVRCIVYCGCYDTENDRTVGESKLKSACARAGIPEEDAMRIFGECTEKASSHEPYMKIAAFVAEYIRRLLCEQAQTNRLQTESYTDYIRRYTSLEYTSNLSLDTFSRILFVNPKHLGRLFIRDTGKSYRKYLSDLRLEKALRLIMTTDRSITDIALSVGFANVTYFNRVFRERYGTSPGNMRSADENVLDI